MATPIFISVAVGLGLVALVAVLIRVMINSQTRSSEHPLPEKRSFKAIELQAVRIEPGSFMMGDRSNEDAGTMTDDCVHQVTLSRPYLIGKYPVTKAQFSQFVSETGFRTTAEIKGHGFVHADAPEQFCPWKGLNWRTAFPNLPDSVPVVCVSWNDARAFCQWLERKTRRKTCLPTEAQWEYACRAGTDSAFNVEGPLDSLGWFGGNSGDHSFDDEALGLHSMIAYKQKVIAEHCVPHPVGLKKPNRWGLYDMHGNVWEWCLDAVAPYPRQAVTDPTGPDDPSAKYRIARGGDWFDPPSIGTSFNRGWWSPHGAYYHIGFRIVQEV